MNKLIAVVACAVATAAFAADKAAEGNAEMPKLQDPKKVNIYTAAAELHWMPMNPQMPEGPQMAFAAGDAKRGPLGIFLKFPAGFDSGWHIHKGYYMATVLKGVITSQGQGDAAVKELPVGSFFSEPANKNHKNTCTAAGECIIFGYDDKGFTFVPKTAEGKNPPKEMVKKEEPAATKKADAAPAAAPAKK